MSSMHAKAAASEIANQFSYGFFDDRMVSDIASIIERHMQYALQSLPTINIYTTPDVWTSQPAPAAASEEAERAAYLERWRNAPEWAQWLAEQENGDCYWMQAEPHTSPVTGWRWRAGKFWLAGQNLLGSVRCEPRPVQGVRG